VETQTPPPLTALQSAINEQLNDESQLGGTNPELQIHVSGAIQVAFGPQAGAEQVGVSQCVAGLDHFVLQVHTPGAVHVPPPLPILQLSVPQSGSIQLAPT